MAIFSLMEQIRCVLLCCGHSFKLQQVNNVESDVMLHKLRKMALLRQNIAGQKLYNSGQWCHRIVSVIPHDHSRETMTKKYLSLVTRKPVFGVSDQVRLKPACSATETS